VVNKNQTTKGRQPPETVSACPLIMLCLPSADHPLTGLFLTEMNDLFINNNLQIMKFGFVKTFAQFHIF